MTHGGGGPRWLLRLTRQRFGGMSALKQFCRAEEVEEINQEIKHYLSNWWGRLAVHAPSSLSPDSPLRTQLGDIQRVTKEQASCLLAPCQPSSSTASCCTDEPVLVLGLSLDSWMCPRPVHIWFDYATHACGKPCLVRALRWSRQCSESMGIA